MKYLAHVYILRVKISLVLSNSCAKKTSATQIDVLTQVVPDVPCEGVVSSTLSASVIDKPFQVVSNAPSQLVTNTTISIY